MRLDPTKECVLSLRDDRAHHALRGKLLPGYTGRDLYGLEGIIDREVEKLVALVEGKYAGERMGSGGGIESLRAKEGDEGRKGDSKAKISGDEEEGFEKIEGRNGRSGLKKMDLGRVVQYFTLDVISSIAFGKSFGHLDKDADIFSYIAATDKALPVMLLSGLLPPVLMFLQSPIMRPLMPKPEDGFGLGKVIGIAREAVATRFGPDGKKMEEKEMEKKDMLGSFLAHGLSRDEAEAEAVVQVIAGSDTTATAIRATMLHVVTNPMVYRRLQREIDGAVEEGGVSRPVVADGEARKLPYLQAVVREGLRIFPPVTGMMPKVSEEDDTVCGRYVPAGTNVCWTAVGIMRNKEVFGEDADVFCPERWLGVSPEKQREMEQWTFHCFSKGLRWECLGKDIAFIELNKVFFEVGQESEAMIRLLKNGGLIKFW